MKLKGQATMNLNNINISNLDYDFKLNNSSIGISSKKNKKKFENGITLESNIGPITLNFDLLTDKYNLPVELEDLIVNVSAKYEINNNLKLGLKYNKNMDKSQKEILYGTINSKLNNDIITLNLSTENIIFGSKIDNDKRVVNLFGNKINPSIGIYNDNINLGYIYQKCQEIDEYGNEDEECDNKLSLDLDIKM